MLKRITHTFIHVLDQDEALDFYVGKLGMVVSTDADLGFMRWLTVTLPDQPDLELGLMLPGPPAYDDATAEEIRELVAKGAAGGGVIFQTDKARSLHRHGRLLLVCDCGPPRELPLARLNNVPNATGGDRPASTRSPGRQPPYGLAGRAHPGHRPARRDAKRGAGSGESSPIAGWRLADNLAEGTAERAEAVEADVQADLGDRTVGLAQ